MLVVLTRPFVIRAPDCVVRLTDTCVESGRAFTSQAVSLRQPIALVSSNDAW